MRRRRRRGGEGASVFLEETFGSRDILKGTFGSRAVGRARRISISDPLLLERGGGLWGAGGHMS